MSLTRMINKTPLANEKQNVYELELVDSQLLTKIIKSRFIGEGVFGIEQYSIDDYTEQYLFTPSFEKYPLPYSNKEWNFKDDLKDVAVFELVLEKPMFMPLDSTQFIDLFQTISEIKNISVFTQVLFCKRVDDWRTNAIRMYDSFRIGNDYPFNNKFIIKIQERVLNIFAKISDYSILRNPIDEIEQKILQPNYRFECRFVIYEEKHVKNFVSEMTKNLQKLTLFNEFRPKKVRNKQNFIKFIENREFQPDLVDQILSEQELYSLLSNEPVSVVEKVELEKPIPQKGVVKSLEDSMLVQRAIQLMPFSENKNVEIDNSKAQQINQAFKRVKIITKPLKINEIHQGATLLKVQMVIPPEITYTSITKKLTDIKAALGNEGVSVEIGDLPDTINVLVPLENRGIIYFRDILESSAFQQHKKKYPLPFIIGENANGGFIFSDLTELRHLLIAGATGSGKSVFVNLLLLSLLLNVPTDELVMYLIDPKQVEYSMFDGFPQVKGIITDMKKADRLLFSLVNEMEQRYDQFAKSGVKNIIGYNKKHDEKMPYIVTSIDEYADLVMVNPNVEEHLVRLGQKARAAGIHLIICTQKPLSDIVTSVLKSNLPSAISFRLKTSADYVTVFGKGIPYNLLGKGDGVCKLEGQMKEFDRFQAPILTLDDETEGEIYGELKKLFSNVPVSEMELTEVKVEEPIDKLKRIIASTGELRVSELQSQMGIAIGKVTELLKQLVEEEWLRREGRGYVINVDDEELNKWRKSGA